MMIKYLTQVPLKHKTNRLLTNYKNMPESIANKLKNYLQKKREENQSYAILLLTSEMSDPERKAELIKKNTEEYKLLKEIYDNTIIIAT